MKITIDTKEDDKGEIKRLISLLTALVNEPVYSNSKDVFEKEGSDGMSAFSSMFGSSENQITDEETAESKSKKDIEIIPY